MNSGLHDNDKADHTIRVYVSTVCQFAAWFEAANGYPLASNVLTPTDLRQYREKLITDNSKPTSTNRVIAALRAFGEWITESHDVANPSAKIKSVAMVRRHEPKSLSKQAQYKLRQALDRRTAYAERQGHEVAWVKRDETIILLLMNTGLRVGELCALKLSDIHLKGHAGFLVVRRGKGMRYREVPLNATAREAITQWLSLRAKLLAGQTEDALFITKYRKPIGTGSVQYLLRELSQEIGVEVTPHTLRHGFAKALVDSAVGLEKVATLMGHTSLETTRIYTTPTQADLAAAVNRLDL